MNLVRWSRNKFAPPDPSAVTAGWARTLGWMAASAALLSSRILGSPTNAAQLRMALTESLGQSKAPGAAWGVHVIKLTNGATVFSSHPDSLFIPASCTKLLTTALALDRLGAGYRVVTPLRLDGTLDSDGTLKGDLTWIGHGAPDLGERRSGSQAAALMPYVDAVAKAGIRRIEGAVVADESWFRTSAYGAGWNWDDLPEAYGAAVSSLSFNDNITRVSVMPGATGMPATIRVEPFPSVFKVVNRTRTGASAAAPLRFERLPGSMELRVSGTLASGQAPHEERLAVPDPALAAVQSLHEAITRRGIPISEPARTRRWHDPKPGHELDTTPAERRRWLAAVTSAPMSELVRDCLKPSQNLHAQLLLLQVGAEIEAHPRPGETTGELTDETGLAALERFLRPLGISRNEFAMEEGSGLSRKNLVTPAATVRLLRHMAAHPDPAIRAAWIAALPIAGVDGTLKSRFTREPARGNIQAKSGTLRHVHSLAGYLTTAGGDRLAFALYLNGFATADPKASGRVELDRLAELLANYSGEL